MIDKVIHFHFSQNLSDRLNMNLSETKWQKQLDSTIQQINQPVPKTQ